MKSQRSVAAIFTLTTVVGVFVACGSPTDGTCEETSTCTGDAGASEGGLGEGGADVVVPPGCDLKTEPRDAPKCVVSEVGVFVDAARGDDAAAGTKEAPVKTIGAALGKLAGKARIYVCEGTYAERVSITSAVSLYGGFACGTWSPSGVKARVAPENAGYALAIAGTRGDVVVSDMAFVAASASAKGESSIAAFVHSASNVVFVRSDLEAGTAKEGADGLGGATSTITAVSGGGALDATGYPASGTTAGTVKTCTCAKGGTTSGAAGGGPNGAGALGGPPVGGAAPSDGVGGAASTNCGAAEPNGTGNTGGDRTNASDAAKITTLGVLDAKGWTPQAGSPGGDGLPGQGGGGGGGRDGAGGGGGCGGCGGTGGAPGTGGGASVALLALDSTIVLRASNLTAKAAGPGGKGGDKGTGATGGNGGVGNCGGGDGGRGGDGGTGSGGAGGISAAVLHKGPAPTRDGSTLVPGQKGDKGTGGTPGSNDGPDGQQGEVIAIP